MDHNQLFQLLITLVMSGASAWGGAKYAIKYLEKTAEKHDTAISALQCDLKKFATIESCKESKVNCRTDKALSVKDIFDKIDRLSEEVIEQNRRREDAKDENSKVYLEISSKLARLEARIESLMEVQRNG